MGFFSWKTADTNESVRNIHSRAPSGTVYLLQPGGAEPIREDAYDGYGVFGDVDAYVWLAEQNLPADFFAGLSEDDKRTAGISLAMGSYYRHKPSGKCYTVFSKLMLPLDFEIIHLPYTYDVPLEEFGGRSANELRASGEFEEVMLDPPAITLKFSFDAGAVYEELPASEMCEDQGFFVEDLDEEFEDAYC